MRHLPRALVVGTLFGVTSAHALDPRSFEASLVEELTALSPAAVEVFEQANDARKFGEWQMASEGYAEVIALAPDFDHAWRRQCEVERRLAHPERSRTLCEGALALTRSPWNLGELAADHVAAGEHATALPLIRDAIAAEPDLAYFYVTWCEIALFQEAREELARCTGQLDRTAPDSWQAPYLRARLAVLDGDASGFEVALDEARGRGLPADREAEALAVAAAGEGPAWWMLVAPVLGGGLLLAAGLWLGRRRGRREAPATATR